MTSIKLTDEEKDKLYDYLKSIEDEDVNPDVMLTPDLLKSDWILAIDFNELFYCNHDKQPIMLRINSLTWEWLSEYQVRALLGIGIEYSLQRNEKGGI